MVVDITQILAFHIYSTQDYPLINLLVLVCWVLSLVPFRLCIYTSPNVNPTTTNTDIHPNIILPETYFMYLHYLCIYICSRNYHLMSSKCWLSIPSKIIQASSVHGIHFTTVIYLWIILNSIQTPTGQEQTRQEYFTDYQFKKSNEKWSYKNWTHLWTIINMDSKHFFSNSLKYVSHGSLQWEGN